MLTHLQPSSYLLGAMGVPCSMQLRPPLRCSRHVFLLPIPTTVRSYLLWGVGVPLSFAIMTIYYRRLSMHNLPPAELVVSSFLPLGALFFLPKQLHAAQLLALGGAVYCTTHCLWGRCCPPPCPWVGAWLAFTRAAGAAAQQQAGCRPQLRPASGPLGEDS